MYTPEQIEKRIAFPVRAASRESRRGDKDDEKEEDEDEVRPAFVRPVDESTPGGTSYVLEYDLTVKGVVAITEHNKRTRKSLEHIFDI